MKSKLTLFVTVFATALLGVGCALTETGGEPLKEGLVARSRATYLMERLPSLREAVVEPPDEVDGDREYTLRRTALAGAEPDLAVLLLQTLCGPSIAGGRPPARAVLQGVLQDAAALGTPARLRDLGGGWTSRTAGDQLSLRRGGLRLEGARPPSQLLVEGRMADWPGGWRIGTRRLDVDSARVKLRAPGAGTQFAVFDPSSLLGPLRVAAVGEGRTMRPFGMGGRRAVRTVLSEAGVSRPRRAGWPAVVDDSGAVLWIPGIRAADRAPLLEGSSSALLLYTTAASDPSRRTAAGPNPA